MARGLSRAGPHPAEHLAVIMQKTRTPGPPVRVFCMITVSAGWRACPSRAATSCRLAGVAVARRHDQPGQGSWFAFEPPAGRPTAPWSRIGERRAAGQADGAGT